jgi:hypothetical protein
MSATPETLPPDTAASGTSGSSRRWDRRRLRRTLTFAGVVALGLVLVVLLALSAQRPTAGLDPEGTGPEGARALAEVLRQQGVEVEVVRSIDDLEAADPGKDTTVFVGDPTNLGQGAAVRVAAASSLASRLVLVGVDSDQLGDIGLPVQAFSGGGLDLTAGCDTDVAHPDDTASAWDGRYVLTDDSAGARSCFVLPSDDGPPDEPDPDAAFGAALVLLDATAARPETVVAGLGPAWTNETIADGSNAGPAVRALGSTPRLLWYQPSSADALAPGIGGVEVSDDRSVWPPWTGPAMALLLATVVLLALARGRRLGRLVREPLPVVVRAIETTQSRGRLYRRAGDRARAATVLRSGTIDRLVRRLALGRGTGTAALVHATAVATGRPAGEVADILSGPAPPDDAALIHLAQQLTDLEERVRHP